MRQRTVYVHVGTVPIDRYGYTPTYEPKGLIFLLLFSDISERNNHYSDTLDFRRGWVGEVTFFVLEVPDYKSAMLIYLCIYIPIEESTSKVTQLQNFHFRVCGAPIGI